MPDDALRPAFLTAFRYNEIGDASPYEISFAGKAKSGGSFGAMQGDLAAKQTIVQQTFQQCLQGAGFSQADIDDLDARLSVHCPVSPLTPQETQRINAALLAGEALVDAMDGDILKDVFADLDGCVATATAAERNIVPTAQIYIALWINMSGKPDQLTIWLQGGVPHLAGPIPPVAPTIDEPLIQRYLKATDYFTKNPGNWPHMVASVAKGVAQLPH